MSETEEYELALARRQAMRRRRRRRNRMRQRIVEIAAVAVLVAVIAIPIWLLCRPRTKPEPETSAPSDTSTSIEPQLPEIVYPVATADTQALGEEVDADCAVLVDVTANRIVAQKHPDTRIYPASVTKVMTLLVAVEHITDYSETFTMPFEMLNRLFIEEASVAGFLAGEKVCMTDLLYGAILPSGADATEALALHVAGSEEAFAALMNQKAEELGLKDTHFTNTSGLHDKEHYTTAADMAVVLRAAMENPLCRQVLSAVSYTTAVTPEHPEGIDLYSTMFSRMYGTEPEVATVIGGKTGYTAQAGHTMVSYAVGQDGHDYIVATMQGSNRYGATYDAINILKAYCGDREEAE
ncbi:MAG: D-alanyl-D-alanine carboxypeptidase [Clostridia bacterium]|nr:D-alanyl-D-alanine carboxypeptidase [Clostridia bacterium]